MTTQARLIVPTPLLSYQTLIPLSAPMLMPDLATASSLVCPTAAIQDDPATDRQRPHRSSKSGKASCRVRASRFQTIPGTEDNANLGATSSAILRQVQTSAFLPSQQRARQWVCYQRLCICLDTKVLATFSRSAPMLPHTVEDGQHAP